MRRILFAMFLSGSDEGKAGIDASGYFSESDEKTLDACIIVRLAFHCSCIISSCAGILSCMNESALVHVCMYSNGDCSTDVGRASRRSRNLGRHRCTDQTSSDQIRIKCDATRARGRGRVRLRGPPRRGEWRKPELQSDSIV